MSLPVPTEAQDHRAFVAYLTMRRYKFTHVANETGRPSQGGAWRGIQNQRNGVSPGFPDFLIIVGDQLIAIELKRAKLARVSPVQRDWIDALNAAGVASRVCYGYDRAVKFVEMIEGLQAGRKQAA